MKTKLLILKSLLLLFLIISCSNDDENVAQDFVVAFEKASISFDVADTQKDVKLVFSRPATENGTIQVKYKATNAVYGTDKDFTTIPQTDAAGLITLKVKSGDSGASFKFSKLKNPVEGTKKSVDFSIFKVSLPSSRIQGNKSLAVSFTETASLGGSLAPELGGHNEPNQVYVDLSSETQIPVKRDTWDLAFYNGDKFRVKLNGAMLMSAGKLKATDINAIKSTSKEVKDLQPKVNVGTWSAKNIVYIDLPNGDLKSTAINEISTNDDDNNVYLLNLGKEIGTNAPKKVGGVVVFSKDKARGWKKIRINKKGNDYVLQYADLDATTYNEITISKNPDYNFTFFSFKTKKVVNVEPKKTNWDLNFTIFTNEIRGYGSYSFSDFVVNNIYGGTKAYMVKGATENAYKNFKLSDVDKTKFSNDQRAIGSYWRSVMTPKKYIIKDRFFIIKDSEGNIYKLKFTALLNENGVRGYPKFEYKLL